MKKITLILLIIVFFKNNLSAQPISLTTDYYGPLSTDLQIIFTSHSSHPVATISGEIESNISTTIIPTLNNTILIKDVAVVSSVTSSILTGKGTVIRPKPGIDCPGGPGCRDSMNLISKIDVVLSQSNNEIQITSNEGLITGYMLYDILGKVILSEKKSPTNNFNIGTTELKTGIYILKIDLENQQYKTIKFIKN